MMHVKAGNRKPTASETSSRLKDCDINRGYSARRRSRPLPAHWGAVKSNVTIDWTVRQNIRADLRVIVKRILRKYGHPPDKQERATQTVLEQADLRTVSTISLYTVRCPLGTFSSFVSQDDDTSPSQEITRIDNGETAQMDS
jgi:hypothetical protein